MAPSLLFVHFLCEGDLLGFVISPLQVAQQRGSWCASKHRRLDVPTFFLVRACCFFQTASRQMRERVLAYSCPHVFPVKSSCIFGCHAREGPGNKSHGTVLMRIFGDLHMCMTPWSGLQTHFSDRPPSVTCSILCFCVLPWIFGSLFFDAHSM